MKAEKNIIILYLAILVNFFIESFILYFDNRAPIILFQTGFNLASVIFILTKVRKINYPSQVIYILLITSLVLLFSILSSDIVHSYNMSLKFITPFLYFIAGYNIINNKFNIIYIFNRLWIIPLFFILNVITVNTLDIGDSFYKEGIKMGYMTLNGLYTVFISLVVLIFFQFRLKRKKIIHTLLTLASVIIFIILLKRTFIILLGITFLILVARNLNVRSTLYGLIIATFSFLVIQNYLSEELSTAVEGRSSRFSEDYEVTSEGRLTENLLPIVHMKDNYLMYIFGTGEVFNDRPYFEKYYTLDRELHNSFARLFWSGGIVLIIVFILFYFSLIRFFYRSFKKLTNKPQTKYLMYFAFSFAILRFINEFSSGITYVSYNSMSYLILGGLYFIGEKEMKKPVKR